MNISIGTTKIPLADYAVGASAILGIRDSGKTVTAKGIAEQLLSHDVPIIVFDAVGKWRWMKVPHAQSYKVVVAGGREPDLPLNPHSVPEIVRSALKERIPLIIDLYSPTLSKADWRRIVQQAIRIIHYENDGHAIHVFLEEAAEFVPQRVVDGEVYAEVEKLVRMGGNASVGITLINQRSQEVNKAVLEQCTTLILGCQIGNRAIEAVEKWVDRLDTTTAQKVTESLPKLKAGECWVWTRQNPDHPSFEKVPMCRSFHPDRRTPSDTLKTLKSADTKEFVSRLSSSIPKVIEDAKSNDPAELKRTISDLKRKLNTAEQKTPEVKVKEVSALTDLDRKQIERAVELSGTVVASIEKENAKLIDAIHDIKTFLSRIVAMLKTPTVNHLRHNQHHPRTSPTRTTPARPIPKPQTNGTLNKCERTLLSVLSQFPEGCHRKKLILIAGYAWSGSTQNALGKLRTMGAISGANHETMQITDHGLELGPFDPLPSGPDLIDHWLNFPHFNKCERTLLRCFVDHPKGLDRERLLEASGYDWSGSTQNALGSLRTAEVITGRNNETMRLSDELSEHL
jgi:hypothetical protein